MSSISLAGSSHHFLGMYMSTYSPASFCMMKAGRRNANWNRKWNNCLKVVFKSQTCYISVIQMPKYITIFRLNGSISRENIAIGTVGWQSQNRPDSMCKTEYFFSEKSPTTLHDLAIILRITHFKNYAL